MLYLQLIRHFDSDNGIRDNLVVKLSCYSTVGYYKL